MKERRVALVIGNSDYRHAEPLRNPLKDARSIAKMLEGLAFDVTEGLNLDREAMENVLFAFEEKLNGADVGLFFFAGHGIQFRGENYLLPTDANITQEGHLKRRAIGLNEILEIMARRAETNLIFLDACRNNPFAGGLFSPGEDAARSLRGGLAEVRAARGAFIAFATSPDRIALDGREAHSPFAAALLKHMPKKGLSINDMMTDVIDEVTCLTGGKQEPWQQSGLRVKFHLNPDDAHLSPNSDMDDETLEHEYWVNTREKLDPNAFERFLSRFPRGDYAGLAADLAAERIASCTDPRQLESLLQDFPGGPRARLAKARLATLMWQALDKRDPSALKGFVERFCESEEAEEARARLLELNRPRAAAKRWKKIFAGGGAALMAGFTLAASQLWPDWSGAGSQIRPQNFKAGSARHKGWPKDWADAGSPSLPRETRMEGPANPGIVPVSVGTDNRIVYIKAGGGKEPGQSFRDCEEICPEMVVVPAGNFLMGSPTDEPERDYDEGPQHFVAIAKPFAVGKYAVTFDEWDACVADGGCGGYKPSDEGWGRGRRPVINVSWHDAQAYVQWISRKTGKAYRLLSEAEREYATRAGTDTPFWWGFSITPDQANYNGNYIYSGGGAKGAYRAKTVPVDRFEPNPWGLYQVHGNVWEWVQDCHVNNYWDAPNDGSSAKEIPGCVRVLRGGSWFIEPRDLRSANRSVLAPTHRYHGIGFRVARTLGTQ